MTLVKVDSAIVDLSAIDTRRVSFGIGSSHNVINSGGWTQDYPSWSSPNVYPVDSLIVWSGFPEDTFLRVSYETRSLGSYEYNATLKKVIDPSDGSVVDPHDLSILGWSVGSTVWGTLGGSYDGGEVVDEGLYSKPTGGKEKFFQTGACNQ